MLNAKSARWRSLDNVAKIFPATSGRKDSRVFRFACELFEKIDGAALQQALNETIEQFPLFCVVLRKGLFWFYFENSDLRPVVKEENRLPCSNIYIRDKKNLLFEVTYFNRRINFEVYHALTDGTGAMQFLKQLVCRYLILIHGDSMPEGITMPDYDATTNEKEDDSFQKYYNKEFHKEKSKKIHAYQLQGNKNDYEHMQIIEGVLSVTSVLEKAREYHVTMTVFLTTLFLCSIHKEMSKRQEKKPVVLMVPVNLRKYFPSASARNFFGWIDVGYEFKSQEDSFVEVLAYVQNFFRNELTTERMALRMNSLIALEQNPILRIAPLELKNLCLMAANKMSQSVDTAIFSNMGVVSLPEVFTPYIRLFDVFTSTPKTELCMCSFEDNLVLSFSSCFESSNIQRNFFRMLTGFGIDAEIVCKQYIEQ